MADLVAQQYKRNDQAFQRGSFRVRGDSLEIWPAHLEDRAWRLSFFGEELEGITEFDPLTGEVLRKVPRLTVYPKTHYVTPRETMLQAIDQIKDELKASVGSDVELSETVDPSILGGLIVKVGSRMVDNSLRTKLQNLKVAMKGVS